MLSSMSDTMRSPAELAYSQAMKSIFYRIWRVARWILAGVLGVVLFVIGCWLFWPDEALEPETQRLMSAKSSVLPADNMYFALWGFGASPDLDPHHVGTKIDMAFAEWRKVKTDRKGPTLFDVDAFYGKQPLRLPDKYTAPCRPESKECLASIRSAQATLEERITLYAPYLAQYRALRVKAKFEEPLDASLEAPLPKWSKLLFISDLSSEQVVRDMDTPAFRAAALQEFAAEVAFWRGLAERADILITKMVAVAGLARKYRLASELLAAYPEIAFTHADAVAEITKPLPPEWAAMKRVMEGEFRFSLYALSGIERSFEFQEDNGLFTRTMRPLLIKTYRVNATLNAQQRQYGRMAAFYSQSAAKVASGAAEFERELGEFDSWSPSTILYNPIGKMLLQIGSSNWGKYSLRLHDAVACSRALEIQRQLNLLKEKTPEAIKGVLDKPELADPYIEKAMVWDGTKGELVFSTRGDKLGVGTARIKVW
jgi:hypothetical protein